MGVDHYCVGRKLRVLTVVDTFSRCSPALEPHFTFRGADGLFEPCDVDGAEAVDPHLRRDNIVPDSHAQNMPSGSEWVDAISFPDNADGLLKITATREQAGTAARRFIREWMQRQRRKARLGTTHQLVSDPDHAPNPPRSAG